MSQYGSIVSQNLYIKKTQPSHISKHNFLHLYMIWLIWRESCLPALDARGSMTGTSEYLNSKSNQRTRTLLLNYTTITLEHIWKFLIGPSSS